MIIVSRAAPAILALLLLTSAGEAPPPAPIVAPSGSGAADVVAQRGDVRFTGTDLKNALNALDPAARAQVTATPQTLGAFARERLLNVAVLSEARSKGWDTRPDVARRIAESRDAVVLQTYLASVVPPDPAYPSEDEITTAYEENKARFVLPKQAHLAQIVLLVKAGATAQQDEEVHKKALDLRAQALRPKADFADLARKNSQERPSAEKGGDVSWLREPDMLPAVKEAIATLTENGISQPIRVPDGWHVLKLLETRAAGPIPLADVKPQLVQGLRQARAQRLMRAYLDEMVKTQPIQVNEIELTKAVTAP